MTKNTSIYKVELIEKLKKGEKSGFVKEFNKEYFLKTLHQKHIENRLND